MTLSQNMTHDRFSSSVCRPCVRCVWTGWRTWSSCAAMAPASCVGTEWASAPSAARLSNAASSSTRSPPPQLTLYPTPDHARKATVTPAAAAWPSSHHSISQPRALSNVLLDTTNAFCLVVFRWIFHYKTRRKYELTCISVLLSSCVLTAARKTLTSQVLLFSHFSHCPLLLSVNFTYFYLICETSFLWLSLWWLLGFLL